MLAMIVACASPVDEPRIERPLAVPLTELAEPVDRVYLPRLDHWSPVDRQHVIVSQGPGSEYLLRLERPVTQQPFNDLVIGVRQHGSYLDSRFDYVIVDGWRYYIEQIRPLTPAQADALVRG